MARPSRPSTRWQLIVCFLLLVLLLGGLWFYLATRSAQAPVNEVTTYLEDDSLWLPDAIVESDDQILEMKFGN
jgi:hypothetical protein